MDKILNVIKGMVIGVSNIIPGVSGGTMAVVMGIYDKLISSITGFFKNPKKHFGFLFQIGIGAVVGILAFSHLIKYLLGNFPQQTNFFFIGLILGSCPILFKKATESKIKPLNYIWFLATFILLLWMGFSKEPSTTTAVLTTLDVKSFISIALAGFIAAATMILPGVSGSFVLMLLGLYETMVTAVSDFNIPLLFAGGIGALIGLITMTKLIEAMFKRYPQTAYMAILGLVLGSVFTLFPGLAFNLVGIISIACGIIGFGIAWVIGKNE